MKKKNRASQVTEEQLNIPSPAAVEPEESYALEDIMREFGGWTQREEPEEIELLWKPAEKPKEEPKQTPPLVIKKQADPPPVVKKQPEPVPEEPKREPESVPEKSEPVVLQEVSVSVTPKAESARSEIMRVAAPEPEKPRHSFKLIDLSGDTIPFQAVREEDLTEPEPEPPTPSAEMPEEPEQIPGKKQLKAGEKAQKRSIQRLKKQEAQRRKAQKAALRAARREEPETVYPSPEDACKAYAKAGTLRLRLLATGLMTLASAVLLLLSQYALAGFDLTEQKPLFSLVLVGLLLGQCVLSYEVFIRGVYQALRLRFDLLSLLTLTVAVTIGDAFFANVQNRGQGVAHGAQIRPLLAGDF